MYELFAIIFYHLQRDPKHRLAVQVFVHRLPSHAAYTKVWSYWLAEKYNTIPHIPVYISAFSKKVLAR